MSHPLDESNRRPNPNQAADTGPQADSRTRRFRHNARRHGLTAALPDGEAEASLMQAFADRWTAQLGAETEAEEALIRSSAIAYARLERCRAVEEATLRTASQQAVSRWEKTQQHAVRRLAQNLSKDPRNTVIDLEETSFGCDWLIRHWVRLDAKLEQGIAWDRDDLSRALLLLGYHPQTPGPDADPDLRAFWHLVRVCSGAPGSPLPGQATDPVPARLDLRARIAQELDRLQALRDDRWHDLDRQEADAIAQLALIDTSKDGQLRQRYRREAFSEMIRGINQVMRLRVERSKDQDRQWHQAHPHVSRKRFATTPSTGAGFPNVAPPPSSSSADDPQRPEPSPPPDSRNEPPSTAPEPIADRLNPMNGKDLRPNHPNDTSNAPRRTEPRRSPSNRPESAASPLDPTTPRGPHDPRRG